MIRASHNLAPETEADLQKLVEPLASYIVAVSQSRAVLSAALILLFQNLWEINNAANDYIDSFSENHFG